MTTESMNQEQFKQASQALSKLPLLGPVMWLLARDERKKFTFIAEQDWLLVPPMILDQLRLFTKQEIPWAYVTWARVNDEVHARLQSGNPRIAPHEWNSGSHCWIVEAIAPFAQRERERIVDEVRQTTFAQQSVHILEVQGNGLVVAQQLPPLPAVGSGQVH